MRHLHSFYKEGRIISGRNCNECLKGLSREMDLAFDDIIVSSVDLNSQQGHFNFFLLLHNPKSVFLAVNVILQWRITISKKGSN